MHGIQAWLGRLTQFGVFDTSEVLVVFCAHGNQSGEDIKAAALDAESLPILIAESNFFHLVFHLSVCLLFLCEI